MEMKNTLKKVLAVVVLVTMAFTLTACGDSQEKAYKKANKLLNGGKYENAAEAFDKLGSYEDASQMSMYARAHAEAENGNYETAVKTFASLGAFRDCEQIPCEWDDTWSFSEGIAYVIKDGKCGFINTKGELVVPCEWDGIWDGAFSEGFTRVKKNGKYGIINTKGELITPCEWDEIEDFNKGFARVKKDGECGIIDTTGKLVSNFDWENAVYSEGYYTVMKGDYLWLIGSISPLRQSTVMEPTITRHRRLRLIASTISHNCCVERVSLLTSKVRIVSPDCAVSNSIFRFCFTFASPCSYSNTTSRAPAAFNSRICRSISCLLSFVEQRA